RPFGPDPLAHPRPCNIRPAAPIGECRYRGKSTANSYQCHPRVTDDPKSRRAILGECVMTDFALPGSIEPASPIKRPDLDKGFNPLSAILFFGVLAAGLLFVAYSIYVDVDATETKVTTFLPFILLFVALLIALGFEFVNGFHDTANAVATVIY